MRERGPEGAGFSYGRGRARRRTLPERSGRVRVLGPGGHTESTLRVSAKNACDLISNLSVEPASENCQRL